MKAEGVTGKIGKKLGEEENQPRNGKKYNKKRLRQAGKVDLTLMCVYLTCCTSQMSLCDIRSLINTLCRDSEQEGVSAEFRSHTFSPVLSKKAGCGSSQTSVSR